MNAMRVSIARRLGSFAMAVLLAGCGGGVDSGGTGSPTFASGPITGFGSVIVGGVHFDETAARITDVDGTVRAASDLRLGMTTEIRASAANTDSSGATTSVANSIVFAPDVIGAVEAVDLAASRLVVLGQTVQYNAATVFDDASLTGGAGALAVGQIVQVYALLDAANQRYTATRIERVAATPAAFRLRAAVASLDTSARRFGAGGAQFSYASLGSTPSSLVVGAIVRLRLATTPVAGVWSVLTVDDGVARPSDHDDARVEGVINQFTSATRFSVEGVAVDASGVTGLPNGLALGARVEVRGTTSAATIVATEVRLKTAQEVAAQDYDVRGSVTSLSPAQSSFVLRGVRVVWSVTGTEFRNGTPANLAIGANVEARGRLSADGTELAAERVTFR